MPKKSNPSLSEVVYEYIKNLIFSKKILSGERVAEQDIADSFGTSRTPVREAIRRLASEGLLIIPNNRIAEVIAFDDKSIKDIGMLRLVLDCFSAYLVINNGSNNDFYELMDFSNRCRQSIMSNDIFGKIKYDCDFHMKLISMSKNEFLMNTQNTLLLKTQLLQTIKFEEESDLHGVIQHENIVNALYERDLKKTYKAIQDHLIPFYKLDGFEFHFEINNLNHKDMFVPK